MNERNTWGWIIGVIVVLLIIGGVWWWAAGPDTGTPGNMASSTTATTTTNTPTGTGGNVTVIDKSSQSIASIVAGLTNSSQYASLFNSTGVGSTLGVRGPYTVFISSDAGYNLLPPGTLANMTAAQKKRMIQYSVVSGKALDIDAQDAGSIKTLSGDEVNFSVGSTGLVQVNSSYAIAEYKASNGIVYVLNQPLLPPTSKNILTP